jgi:hypothetical protein
MTVVLMMMADDHETASVVFEAMWKRSEKARQKSLYEFQKWRRKSSTANERKRHKKACMISQNRGEKSSPTEGRLQCVNP